MKNMLILSLSFFALSLGTASFAKSKGVSYRQAKKQCQKDGKKGGTQLQRCIRDIQNDK